MRTRLPWRRGLALLVGVLAVGVLLSGCSRYTNSSSSGTGGAAKASGCAELLADARRYVRSGETGDGRLDWVLDEMAQRCDREYDVFVDEVSGGKSGRSEKKNEPKGALSWRNAIKHVGSKKYVCGPLINSGASGDDVFLNLGRGYPDRKRFTIVVWDVGRVESIPKGTTLCTTGRITIYQGVAQIQVRNPAAVEIWD